MSIGNTDLNIRVLNKDTNSVLSFNVSESIEADPLDLLGVGFTNVGMKGVNKKSITIEKYLNSRDEIIDLFDGKTFDIQIFDRFATAINQKPVVKFPFCFLTSMSIQYQLGSMPTISYEIGNYGEIENVDYSEPSGSWSQGGDIENSQIEIVTPEGNFVDIENFSISIQERRFPVFDVMKKDVQDVFSIPPVNVSFSITINPEDVANHDSLDYIDNLHLKEGSYVNIKDGDGQSIIRINLSKLIVENISEDVSGQDSYKQTISYRYYYNNISSLIE